MTHPRGRHAATRWKRTAGEGSARSAIRPKARKAPTAQVSTADLQEQLDRRTRERDEALEQLGATSDVLQVISRSAFDLKSVLQTLVESAARLCKADKAAITRQIGGEFFFTETYGLSPEFIEHVKTVPVKPERGTVSGLVLLEGRTVHVPDVRVPRDPAWAKAQELGGFRSILGVPMLRDGTPIGVLALVRAEAQPFTDKQIELVQNFANQAVVAIENTRLLNELRQRTDDLTESLEQQTATSEVLKVISSSAGELEPVFQTMLANATQICEAAFGSMLLVEGNALRRVAMHNAPPMFAEFHKKTPVIDPRKIPDLKCLIETKRVVHVADAAAADPDNPIAKYAGARTLVVVPMLKDGDLIGAIAIYRQEVRPFTNKQIELVTNFAAQAVIAIENTRLLNELRQRTDDLSESLEQQTATSEVLKVISGSPSELKPVFDAILENATRICEAKFGTMWLREGDAIRVVALHNAPPAYEKRRRNRLIHLVDLHSKSAFARFLKTRQVTHIADIRVDQGYLDGAPTTIDVADAAGARTVLMVPMLKDNELVGSITIYRQEVRPFTDKQIELVKNFASQAVIAIENARLLNELRESLQQQTATADVLKVISSSPGDLEPVFRAMLEKATQICGAKFGVMFRFADGAFRAVSWLGSPPAYTIEQPHIVSEHPHNPLTRIVSTKKPVHISDLTKERAYIEDNPRIVALVETAGARSLLVVPMVKNEELIGAIAVYWQEARSFTEKQIELISNFAAQAVIAIDNTRLLSELRESLQQQTATADVLKVISRSTFDLQTVLDTLVELVARLCEAEMASINREKGAAYQRVASYGYSPELQAYMDRHPIPAGQGSVVGRTVMEGGVIHIHDVLADPDYKMAEAAKLGGIRTMLGVPLLREGTSIGVLVLQRKGVRPFTDKQIELATTFADQAVIAIENARLLSELRQRTTDLSKSLDDLRTTQDRLVQTQKLASLGQLTAGIAHEIKNPLNFVNNFSVVSSELIDELQDTLKDMPFNDKARAEIKELTDTLKGNLDKVVQHGKRADAIVKNMLLHSREGSGEHRRRRYQYHRRGKPQPRLSRGAGREAGLHHYPRAIIGSRCRCSRRLPAGYYTGAAEPYLERLLRSDQAQSGSQWRRLRADPDCGHQKPWRPRGDQDSRQRHRHSSRSERENIQPVLHHQACWRRHRAWPVHQSRHHRQATWRLY